MPSSAAGDARKCDKTQGPEDEDLTHIQAWQQRTRPNFQEHPTLISDVFQNCVELLQVAVQHLDATNALGGAHMTLKEAVQTLFLWGHGYGAGEGRLDAALHLSEELYDSVLGLLTSIVELVVDDLLHLVLPDTTKRHEIIDFIKVKDIIESAHAVMTSSEVFSSNADDFEDLAVTIETQVECLTSLAPAIEYPAPGHRGNTVERVPSAPLPLEFHPSEYLSERPAHQFYTEPLRSKFPLASEKLIERLAKANWSRYQHIQRQRETTASKRSIEILVQTNVGSKSGFQDSGLGTSIPDRQEDTESRASSRASSSHKHLPPLPSNARQGDPFMCEVCYEIICISRTQPWKKHVFNDLLSYSCFFEDCPSRTILFGDSEKMIAHITSEHNHAVEQNNMKCPLCAQLTGDSQPARLKHLIRHMEEISLSALPPSFESDSEVEESSSERSSVINGDSVAHVPEGDCHGLPPLASSENSSPLGHSTKDGPIVPPIDELRPNQSLPLSRRGSEIAEESAGKWETRREGMPLSEGTLNEVIASSDAVGVTGERSEAAEFDELQLPRLPSTYQAHAPSPEPDSPIGNAHVPPGGPESFKCDYPGCSAPPFQTQYLLNSHANVHSQARPHYCPVPGCSRGEGGKGFKRKNEMIRHGLVHDSPGYVCPFCPERDHKYATPDQLARHVRVYHVDRDKDDPMLREVLAQRPEGSGRGRRRRMGS